MKSSARSPLVLAAFLLALAAPVAAEPQVFRGRISTPADLEFPVCYEPGEIYDSTPCPPAVLAKAAELHAASAPTRAAAVRYAAITGWGSGLYSPGEMRRALRDDPPTADDPSVAVEPEPQPIARRQGLISPELREKLLDRAVAEAQKRTSNPDDPYTSAAGWVYCLRGACLTDVGASMALERWACHILPGRTCFAGILAGKKTIGAGIGSGLRSDAALAATPEGRRRWQVVVFLAFVIPYDSAEVTAAPAGGIALKF